MSEYLATLIRHVLTVLGTWFVVRGIADQDTVNRFVESLVPIVLGSLMYLIAQVWAFFHVEKTQKKLRSYEARIENLKQGLRGPE